MTESSGTAVMEGGCQCGRVRFRATVRDDAAYLCHCRMCQRAFGNVSIAWRNMKKADVAWTAAPPDLYASSPIAERGFCATCGTSLTFQFPDSANMDLAVATFDAPERFRPAHHFGMESWHAQWLDTSHLPQYRADEHAPTTERWMKTVGKLPD